MRGKLQVLISNFVETHAGILLGWRGVFTMEHPPNLYLHAGKKVPY
jgi:hypothetical protein